MQEKEKIHLLILIIYSHYPPPTNSNQNSKQLTMMTTNTNNYTPTATNDTNIMYLTPAPPASHQNNNHNNKRPRFDYDAQIPPTPRADYSDRFRYFVLIHFHEEEACDESSMEHLLMPELTAKDDEGQEQKQKEYACSMPQTKLSFRPKRRSREEFEASQCWCSDYNVDDDQQQLQICNENQAPLNAVSQNNSRTSLSNSETLVAFPQPMRLAKRRASSSSTGGCNTEIPLLLKVQQLARRLSAHDQYY